MARSITDARQVTIRSFLQQIANAASYAGTADSKPANQSELDNLLSSLNAEVTPLLRMSASSTPDLVVTIGAGKLTNPESSYTRAIPHVGTAYVQFAAGTLTFPAASGGNIVASPGNPSVLTVGVGNYAAVLIYLDGNGNLNTIVGAEDAVEATAITNLPPSPDSTLPIGYVVVHNTAGVIDAIAQDKISQFGTGAGGGGSGDASLAEVALRDRFAQSGFKYLDPNIFKRDKDTKVDGASTGVFDLVKSAFKLTSIGQTYVSTNLANSEFLAEGVDITEIELITYWLLNFVDSAAVYEASRDGGTNWTTLDMARVGTDSNAFRGYQVFEDESTQQSLQTVAATGAGTALNATTAQQLSSQLVMSSTGVVRSIDLLMNKAAAAVGNLYVSIVRDNAGVPSTDLEDLISESNAVNIATLSTGDITVTVDLPQSVLTAGTYHVVLRTDAEYKAGTMDLSWRSGAGTNGAAYNGTVWTGSASTKAATVKGRLHDLRIRITGSAVNRYIEAVGVNFGSDDGILAPNGSKNVQRFYFTGDENRTQFLLNWTPDPDILEMYDVYRGQVYVIDNDTVRLSGQTVIFDPDTFDFPGEDILLIARQIKGVGIDNSDSNAAAISEHASNLLDLGTELNNQSLEHVELPKIAVPFTTITNRAKIPDLSQDLAPRLGIERMQIQNIYRIYDEVGPNGEPIMGAVNDKFNQVRFGGGWIHTIDGNGQFAHASSITGSFCEVTFYGTGLNLLTLVDANTRVLTVSIDGGAFGANVIPNGTANVTGGRLYSPNTVVKIASGLALGIHTVKFLHSSAGNPHIYGFDIITEASEIQLPPGSQYLKGKKITHPVLDSTPYNSDFETGVLGTRGGRAIIYQKSDGTIAKAVNPTDASQLNLTAANHANEEVIRSYFWREFGVARADDFQVLHTASARAFTLDDGTTTLVSSLALSSGSQGGSAATEEAVIASNDGVQFVTFTFVGTGLDILLSLHASSTTSNLVWTVDGTSLGNMPLAGLAGKATVMKVVSGLPYGTHTARFRTDGTGTLFGGVNRYIVYGPKKPTVPTNAVELSDYFIMADYSGAGITGTAIADNMQMPVGALYKAPMREFIYQGANQQVFPLDANSLPGFTATTLANNNQPTTYTFFGTGFVLHMGASVAGTYDFTVNIDGALNATGVARSNASNLGGGSYRSTASAAAYQPVRIEFTGLTLGVHTVILNRTAGTGNITFQGMHIITPVHIHKVNGPFVSQNSLSIGSQGLGDSRKFAKKDLTLTEKYTRAFGLTAGPTTTSTAYVPAHDLLTPIYLSKPSRVFIDVMVANSNSSGTATANDFLIQVNGIGYGQNWRTFSGTGGVRPTHVMTDSIILGAGFHLIQLHWRVSSATGTLDSTERVMNVEVQELD